MKRKIITIDEEKCTGCGACIPDCPEGALQMIEGKARLVSDLFCDGLGACLGTCPEGAISIIEREAGAYDETAVMETIARQGPAVIRAHLEHLDGHGQIPLYNQAIEYLMEHFIPIPEHHVTERRQRSVEKPLSPFAGCPGTAARRIDRNGDTRPAPVPVGRVVSELRQWPVQLALLNPTAPYFDDADLLIAADCVPFAYANFHQDLLRDTIVIVFCPKLDADIEGYIAKLAEILSLHTIRSITVAHMEVPCCSGVNYILDRAMESSGKTIPVKEYTISLQGEIIVP